jgi:hypothetical protein
MRLTRRIRHHGHIIRGVIDRDWGAALNNAISPPHQLARQLLDSLPKVSVSAHVEQLIDNLFQRRRINMAAEGLRNFPDRVVGGWHVGGYTALSSSGNVLIYAGASVGANAVLSLARSAPVLD